MVRSKQCLKDRWVLSTCFVTASILSKSLVTACVYDLNVSFWVICLISNGKQPLNLRNVFHGEGNVVISNGLPPKKGNSKTSLMTGKNDTGWRFLYPKNCIHWFSQSAITELLVPNIPHHIIISPNWRRRRLKIDDGAIRFLGHNNDALITLISKQIMMTPWNSRTN